MCASVRLCTCACVCAAVGLSGHSVHTDFWGSENVWASEGLSMCEPLLVCAQTACVFICLNVCIPVELGTCELAGRSVNVHVDVRVRASGQTHVCIQTCASGGLSLVCTSVCLDRCKLRYLQGPGL